MIQGSGEIYRHVVTGWFNGRYLIFAAPLLAFSSTALVAFVATRGKKVLTASVTILVLTFYLSSMVLNPLAVGSTTALSDGKIMPYRGDMPYAIDIGKALKRVYTGGYILDFTLSKSTPIIQLYSGINLKYFIDVNNKEYWKDSKEEPWTHVNYAILQKPIDHSNGVHINQSEYYDPVRDNILYWNKNMPSLMSPWQPIGDSLLSSIKVAYENDNFIILKNERKDIVLDKISDGLRFPSKIAIIGKDDILVAEKKTGIIHRIVNGHMLPQPILDANVATNGERGILGIAASKNEITGSTYVFLYYTQATAEDGDDVTGYREPLGNRLYRYELVDNKLVNPKLLLDLPIGPLNVYNVGKVVIGPDSDVYVLASYIGNSTRAVVHNELGHNIVVKPKGGQINITNTPTGLIEQPNQTSKIIRVTQDGIVLPTYHQEKVRDPVVENEEGKAYPYGIPNDLSIDFDPVTKYVWLVENDDYRGQSNQNTTTLIVNANSNLNFIDNSPLVSNGIVNEKESASEFTWNNTVGPTTIDFLNSNKLGKEYENDLFVGDINSGDLYHFDLNKNRTGLLLNGTLADKIANDERETKSQVLLSGLGGITDIESADDGYLYFSTIGGSPQQEETFPSNDGAVYRLKLHGN